MTNAAHIATITAYETINDDFAAICRDEATGENTKLEGFATLEEATYAAKMMAWAIAPCTYAEIKKGSAYYANAWAASTIINMMARP